MKNEEFKTVICKIHILNNVRSNRICYS